MSAEENTFTLVVDAETIREHVGSGWDADVAALCDEVLNKAGALALDRVGDAFWQEVDGVYSRAVAIAREMAGSS